MHWNLFVKLYFFVKNASNGRKTINDIPLYDRLFQNTLEFPFESNDYSVNLSGRQEI